jgi:hypothetical protein
VCFAQSGTVVTMLGGHRVRVANTGNCIANRGESLLSASSRGFLSLLRIAPIGARAAVNNNASRIFIYAGLGPTCTFLTQTHQADS